MYVAAYAYIAICEQCPAILTSMNNTHMCNKLCAIHFYIHQNGPIWFSYNYFIISQVNIIFHNMPQDA